MKSVPDDGSVSSELAHPDDAEALRSAFEQGMVARAFDEHTGAFRQIEIVDITLSGCDDTTRIEGFEVGAEFLPTLVRIALASQEVADYGCMPTFDVRLRSEDPAAKLVNETLSEYVVARDRERSDD